MKRLRYRILYWMWRHWHNGCEYKSDRWSRFRCGCHLCCGGDARRKEWTVRFCEWLEWQWRTLEEQLEEDKS